MKGILSSSDQVRVDESLAFELSASLAYRQLSAAMKRAGYFGAAAFFDKESHDEMAHYVKWEDFANDCGYLATVPTIKKDFETPVELREAVKVAYDMERELLEAYCNMLEIAEGHVLHPILHEFITTQRLAVGEYGDLLSTLDRVRGDAAGTLMVDQQMKEAV